MPPVSTTLGKMVAKFATGVVDTSGKFAAGVVDTGGNLPPVLLTLVANLPPVSLITVVHLVYRRPYFTGLRISTQTVSFTIDNFSSFLHKNRTLTALYTFLLISGPPSDFIEDVELWLARLLSLTIGSPSLHLTCRHSRGERPLTPPHPGNDFEIRVHTHTQACGLN